MPQLTKEEMEEFNNSLFEEDIIGRFSVISRTYSKNFKKCVVIIFDSNNGEIEKKEINLE